MDNETHERAPEDVKEETTPGYPTGMQAKGAALMDAVTDLIVEATKGESAWRFVAVMICYQTLYLVGQIGEAILRRAMIDDPEALAECRAHLQSEMVPTIQRFVAGIE